MERGFVNVNDLQVWVVHHAECKASHKVLLEIAELSGPSLLLQEHYLWLFVSHPQALVVLPQRRVGEAAQLQL